MKKFKRYTKEEILEAVKQNGYALRYVENYYKELVLIVCNHDYKDLKN